jgi:phenylacetate-CoA ligase
MSDAFGSLSVEDIPRSELAFSRVINFAARHAPAYRDQSWARTLRRGGAIDLAEIPLTQKSAVKDANESFFSDHVPREEGTVDVRFTSGSTGTPLKIPKTQRHFLVNGLENTRLHQGWGYNDHERKVVAASPGNPRLAGKVEESRMESGSRRYRIASFGAEPVAGLLRETRATFLVARPSIALAVLQDNPDIDFLRLIATVGEVVPPELQVAIASLASCAHADAYGSIESGIIAGLCKACGRYHVAHRHLIVELLDESGNPVEPGEMGRVVVTPLFNLAMPLIRYEIGDYAIYSRKGPCDGKGMAFDKVLGRERNLFKLPGGTRVTPYLSPEELIELGVRRCKLVQTALAEVEFRYIPMNEAVSVSAEAAQRMIDIYVSPKLKAIPVKVSELPPASNGKYLMHESLI